MSEISFDYTQRHVSFISLFTDGSIRWQDSAPPI